MYYGFSTAKDTVEIILTGDLLVPALQGYVSALIRNIKNYDCSRDTI